jgi:uncharacterized membrane protein
MRAFHVKRPKGNRMKTKNVTIVSLILIALATLAGAVLWNQLPEQMPSHWDFNDQVNGYLPRFWGVFLMPLISLGMLVLFLFIPSIDPLKANITQFRNSFNFFILLTVAFMLYIHGLTLAWSLGYRNFRMSTAMLPFLDGLFVAIGLVLRKAKGIGHKLRKYGFCQDRQLHGFAVTFDDTE